MKRFHFPLEGLLRIRDLHQKRVMQEMAVVMERVNAQREIVDRAEQEYAEEMDRFAGEQVTGAYDIERFRMFDRYIDRLEGEKAEAHAKLEEMRPELEAMQARLLDARKEKRVVEILKERHLERYREDVRRVERKELEELNRIAVGRGPEEVVYGMDRSMEDIEPPESTVDEGRTEDLRTREARRRAEYLKQAGLTEEQARRAVGL